MVIGIPLQDTRLTSYSRYRLSIHQTGKRETGYTERRKTQREARMIDGGEEGMKKLVTLPLYSLNTVPAGPLRDGCRKNVHVTSDEL